MSGFFVLFQLQRSLISVRLFCENGNPFFHRGSRWILIKFLFLGTLLHIRSKKWSFHFTQVAAQCTQDPTIIFLLGKKISLCMLWGDSVLLCTERYSTGQVASFSVFSFQPSSCHRSKSYMLSFLSTSSAFCERPPVFTLRIPLHVQIIISTLTPAFFSIIP